MIAFQTSVEGASRPHCNSTTYILVNVLIAGWGSSEALLGTAPASVRRLLSPHRFHLATHPWSCGVQVLCDPRHSAVVAQLVPLARARAARVLEGVKRRGASEGDYMDAATEAALWPDVFQEAFAREVVAMVSQASVSAHASLVCVLPWEAGTRCLGCSGTRADTN